MGLVTRSPSQPLGVLVALARKSYRALVSELVLSEERLMGYIHYLDDLPDEVVDELDRQFLDVLGASYAAHKVTHEKLEPFLEKWRTGEPRPREEYEALRAQLVATKELIFVIETMAATRGLTLPTTE